MNTHHIYAEQTVSITELRKNPAQFFRDEPVAVLSNNKPAGYMLSAELYERLIHLLEENANVTDATFRPSRARMEAIAKHGEALLLSATNEDLGTFQK